MNRILITFIAAILLACASAPTRGGDKIIGINAGWPTYWAQAPFLNIAVDYEGKTFAPFEGGARMAYTNLPPEHIEYGRHRFTFDGRGQLLIMHMGNNARVTQSGQYVEIIPTPWEEGPGITWRVVESDPADPVRNLAVVHEKYTELYDQGQRYHPLYVAKWQGAHCIRFMDTLEGGATRPVTWDTRPAHIEDTIQLINQIGADGWYCIPVNADDDYVRRFAELLRAKVDPRLKVRIEYGNEIWNFAFATGRAVHERAVARGWKEADGSTPDGFASRFHEQTKRSIEIFRIFDEVFAADKDRIVRVIGSQAAWGPIEVGGKRVNWMAYTLLSMMQAEGYLPNVIAIAPYIGDRLRGDGSLAAQWPAVDEAIDAIRTNQNAADLFEGVEIEGYEGGVHFSMDYAVVKEMYNDPLITEMYQKWLDGWHEITGGALICLYKDHGLVWGVDEYFTSPANVSPRSIAYYRNLKPRGPPEAPPEVEPEPDPGVPEPPLPPAPAPILETQHNEFAEAIESAINWPGDVDVEIKPPARWVITRKNGKIVVTREDRYKVRAIAPSSPTTGEQE